METQVNSLKISSFPYDFLNRSVIIWATRAFNF